MSVSNDPWDVASEATLQPRSYFGQIQVDTWFCALVKGVGKEPFDPAKHKQRATAVDISLLPIAEQNISFELKRETIAESPEWVRIIWQSLKDLGMTSLRDAHGKWAKMQQVPSGRKYRDKNGEEKEATTFRFLAIYPDEAACRAAYLADAGKTEEPAPAPAAVPTAAPSNGNGNGNHAAAIAKVKPFIMVYAKQNNYDLSKTQAACKGQKFITDAIDVEGDDFAAIVVEALAAGSK